MLTEEQAQRILTNFGAVLKGHFIGTQEHPDHPGMKGLGLHMPEYVDGRVLVTYPLAIEQLAQGIADRLREYQPDVVVGMPIGAYTLGSEVAKALGVRFAMAERTSTGGIGINRPAFVEVVRGKRVVAVEDTVNAGDTIQRGLNGILDCGGAPVAVGAIITRGRVGFNLLGVPLHPLVSAHMLTVTRQECLAAGQCSRGEPINRTPGHGRDLETLIREGYLEDPGYTFVN